MTTREQLAACPFCGGDGAINSNGIGDSFVRCEDCGAETSDVRCETEEQAAKRWNRRVAALRQPEPAPVPEEVEQVAKAMERGRLNGWAAMLCSLAREVAAYHWLLDCAKKTGITVTFNAENMSVIHGAFHEDLERAEAALAPMVEALTAAQLCIEDEVNIYAPEECDSARVEQARARHAENGTLYYYATVLKQIRNALSLYAPSEKREQTSNVKEGK